MDMKEYYIIYGWIFDDDGYMWPVPWGVTEDEQKAIRYFSYNTDESLSLVIVKVSLNSDCLSLSKVSRKLENYVNNWDGNKLAWTHEQWEALTTYYDGKDPEIFELSLEN